MLELGSNKGEEIAKMLRKYFILEQFVYKIFISFSMLNIRLLYYLFRVNSIFGCDEATFSLIKAMICS